MKKILALLFSVFSLHFFVLAQNNLGKTEDMGRISLTPVVSDQYTDIPNVAKQILSTKLQQLASDNGLGAGNLMPRFIITATINVLTKDIIPGPPQMVAENFEVVFFIADYFDQKVFSSVSINLKGVGINETKAFIEGIKLIKPKSPDLKQFVESGKTKIIEYYNSKCDFILKNALSLSSQRKYEEAIYTLTSVPEVCKECFDKAMDAAGPIYQQYVNYLCDQNLAKAKASWAGSMDTYGAQDAGNYLSQIYPDAKCYKEAQELVKEIKERTKELWKFEMKKYDNEIKLEQQRINAYRDVGVAYGNHQQPMTYNTYFLHY